MAASFFRQFQALLWKCYLIRRRATCSLICELILPLILCIALTAVIGMATRDTSSTYERDGSFERDSLSTESSLKISWENIPNIYYAPENKFTHMMAEQMKIRVAVAANRKIQTIGFSTENEMIRAFNNKSNTRPNTCIVYEETTDETDIKTMSKIRYKLISPVDSVPDPTQSFPNKFISGQRGGFIVDTEYDIQFIELQTLLNEAFLNKLAEVNEVRRIQTLNLKTEQYPYPSNNKPTAPLAFDKLVSFFVVFGFIVTFPIIVNRVTKEKLNKSREMFRLMGMTDWVYWLTTILMYFIILFIQIIVIWILFMVKFNGSFAVINAINPIVNFLIFTIFGLNMILFALLVSIPFSRPVLGTIFSLILWVVTFIVPMVFLDPIFNSSINIGDTNDVRILCCLLLPNFAFSVAMLLVGQHEIYGSYADWSTLFEPIGTFGKLTLGLVFVLMIMSTLLMSLLIWYLDNVWPWQDGVPKPIWFPFTKNYWFPRKSSEKATFDSNSELQQNPDHFEKISSEEKKAISIRNLRKKFGKKRAVDGVNLDIFHGQITCLLGHNGAGKTTTMELITGMISADGGKISVNGYDVATQIRDARGSMSLCPQHNVLYEELKVIEHLRLYAAIKGLKWNMTTDAAIKVARYCQLELVLDRFPKQLSGGMKRKLCLSIALVGDTSVVILDEPTSGLDPEARRAIWDLLRQVRRDRTILLTTHFMEEADALGDRIAIMSAGRMSCYGTPMFLKKAFSTGYQLRVAKGLAGNQFNRTVLMSIVQRHFPKGFIKSDIDNEVIISLESNQGQTDSRQLPEFLKDIENDKNKLGIDAFGVYLTTLEDVFLKVGELAEGHETLKLSLSVNSDGDGVRKAERPIRVTGIKLNLLRLKGLIFKRYNYARRTWPSIIFQMLLPCLLIGFCFWTTNIRLSRGRSKSGVLDIQTLYGSTYGYCQSESEPFTQSYKRATDESSVHLTELSGNFKQQLNEVIESISLSDYITKYLTSVVVSKVASSNSLQLYRNYTIWYNNEALHAWPVSLNLFYEALFRELSDNKFIKIELTSQPIEVSEDGMSEMPTVYTMTIIWLMLMSLSIPFLGASYSIFPTHERASKAKLLQLMTGVNPCLFWLASFLFDMCTHLITTALIMCTFAIMDTYKIIMEDSSLAFAIFILFVVYGLATILLAYLFSKMFAKPSTVFLVLVIIYAVTSIILTAIAYVLELLSMVNIENIQLITKSKLDDILWYFRVSPVFSAVWATAKVYKNGLQPALCKQISNRTLQSKCNEMYVDDKFLPCCVDKCRNYKLGENLCAEITNPFTWADNGINKEIFVMIIFCLIAFILLCVVEFGFVRIYYIIRGKLTSVCDNNQKLNESTVNPSGTAFVAFEVEDADVVAEHLRVENLFRNKDDYDQEALVIRELRKRFGRFIAVDGISFGVHNQECFGLLGVNGAGKTTTFRMLTGDLRVTSGNAMCGAFSINDSLSNIQQKLGYCPQFDALLDKLSGREMLFLFGRLRGIPENMLSESVDKLITMCDLSAHIDKKTQAYSGGNKRKLSLAIALVGSPNVLLLDEPTSGVDPAARRHIWSTLATIRQKFGCSIVLSSHSMDECEALCSRLGIMVNGKLKCLGSVQHIKERYGKGYTVIITLKESLVDTKENVKNEFEKAFKNCATLQDAHHLLLKYHVNDVKLTWSHMFETMEGLKNKLKLDDYAVSGTTLDQIFIIFARGQQNAK